VLYRNIITLQFSCISRGEERNRDTKQNNQRKSLYGAEVSIGQEEGLVKNLLAVFPEEKGRLILDADNFGKQ